MTPHLASEASIIPSNDGHLTEEQFGELIAESSVQALRSRATARGAHLRVIASSAPLSSPACSECLSLFREASTAYANRELRRRTAGRASGAPPPLCSSPGFKPAYLAAAAALVLAALLPMQLLHRRAPHPAPAVATKAAPAAAESDEALLEDVNR
jgi:hypothetical protein